MTMLVLDPADQMRMIAERQRFGGDTYDEVWDGVYIMSPSANPEHSDVATNLASCCVIVITFAGLGRVNGATNVSDRTDDWTKNYRCPDVAVFLNENPAKARESYWLGGPDFAVEVVSRYDRSREKFDFYARVNTRELLIVDRYPWALELYRLNGVGAYDLVGTSTVARPDVLSSVVVPLSFQLEAGADRPRIRVTHADGTPSWSA